MVLINVHVLFWTYNFHLLAIILIYIFGFDIRRNALEIGIYFSSFIYHGDDTWFFRLLLLVQNEVE